MRKVLSFLLVAVFLMAPVSAASSSGNDVEYVQKSNFWTWVAGKDSFLHDFIGHTFGKVCPNSDDGYHHASSYERPIGNWTAETGYYKCICDLCGAEFKAYEKDLQQSYDQQVSSLPATGYNSSGSLIWYVGISDLELSLSILGSRSFDKFPYTSNGHSYDIDSSAVYYIDTVYGDSALINVSFDVITPISGSYRQLPTPAVIIDYVSRDNGRSHSLTYYYEQDNFVYMPAGTYEIYKTTAARNFSAEYSYLHLTFPFPVFEIRPITSFGDTYNINSRPASISGDYGIIGDNGQITKVDSNTIVNETNNTIYNPVTGETHTMSDWSFNYEDRSYTVTTSTGDTITITYGDENITIVQGGDTYNIYYIIEGSGSGGTTDPDPGPGTDPDVPDVCDHVWTETGRTEPSCTIAGKVSYQCSKCSQTKTETISATGHTWVVDRTVQSTYDEEGNLLQQGYTIYSCSVCGEEYKDMEGTGPPGGEEEKSIWEKIGDLIGSGLKGILEIIGAILSKILDALIYLLDMLMGKLKDVVEAILSIFDVLPSLFGGFLAFLSAMFPFLPPEIMTLLTFGIAAVIFIGIIKAIRR